LMYRKYVDWAETIFLIHIHPRKAPCPGLYYWFRIPVCTSSKPSNCAVSLCFRVMIVWVPLLLS
jgi:hypothetical protein